jgi:hypothetical protein
MMEKIFTLQHVPLLALAVLAAEAIILRRWLAMAPGIVWCLLAGGALVLALGAALMGHGFIVIAPFLTLSFVFHILELRQWLIIAKRSPA